MLYPLQEFDYGSYFKCFCILVSSMVASVATASDAKYPALDFYSLYQRVESAPFPIEYVYTEGANKPAFEKFAVPKFYVADLNNNRCDDVLLDWADSAGEPIVFFGNKSGKLEARDVFPGHNKVRTIREAGFEDLNGDGFLDIVGFSISHDKPELNWDFYEPEFIALSDGDGQFSVMKNKIKTESHAGLLADLNHDGNMDILPLNTIKASQSIKVVDSSAAKVSKLALRRFGLRKETITAHGDDLLTLLNFNGTNAEYCEKKSTLSTSGDNGLSASGNSSDQMTANQCKFMLTRKAKPKSQKHILTSGTINIDSYGQVRFTETDGFKLKIKKGQHKDLLPKTGKLLFSTTNLEGVFSTFEGKDFETPVTVSLNQARPNADKFDGKYRFDFENGALGELVIYVCKPL